jgi:hypothetical protein
MPTVFANLLSNFSAYGPEVSQKSMDAFIAAVISSWPNTLPVTGTGVTPGINALLAWIDNIASFARAATAGFVASLKVKVPAVEWISNPNDRDKTTVSLWNLRSFRG